MKKYGTYFMMACLWIPSCSGFIIQEKKKDVMNRENVPVFKKTLSNGLVVLVRPVNNVPKVSTQLWYHVGSKDEMSGEKGKAHLIEHMIFKGTKKFSETDVSALTQKLSGYTNAFTSYDYTGYVFDFPSHHWKEALTLYADCMRNCRFDEQMLNSELKAVIQELKLMKDNYFKILWQSMLSAIFVDHPYHYPVIGFKQDLWNLKRDDLFAFYQKHYVPNNATLVVVGDVTPEEVFAEAEKTLGGLQKDPMYQRREFYHGKDLVAQSVVVHRDVQQPYGLFAFVLPGAKHQQKMEMEVLSGILGEGKSSRLSKKLVDDLELVTEFSTFVLSLEDASVFLMYFCAKDEKSIEEIRNIILAEIDDIVKNGVTEKELLRAVKQVKVGILSSLESNSSQAQMIAESYVLAGDENLPFKMLTHSPAQLGKNIQELLKEYFSPATMHSGKLLSLNEEGKVQWKKLQELSDKEDARILDGRVRDIPIEETFYADTVAVKDPKKFNFHKSEKFALSNGLRVFSHNNKNIPKIELILTLHAKNYFDSDEKPGLYQFVCEMLTEGTKKYPGHTFIKELEEHAMGIVVSPGVISLSFLKEDLPKALELLRELLINATFEEKAIEKVRASLLTQLKMFWDQPKTYAPFLMKQRLFAGHPYGKNIIGTEESLASITREDLETFYKTYISAYKARLAIVGDLEGYNLKQLLEKELGELKNKELPVQHFPELKPVVGQEVSQVANRDQVVLMFAGISIPRTHPDYDKLLLFDQILSGSMDSHLFKLRERTGLFYTINASLIGEADEQPGTVYVSTIVSLDRLDEAKKSIQETLKTVIDKITPEEFETAKKAVLNAQVNWFTSNARMASAFLFVDRYNLTDNYFDLRPDAINAITLEQMKEAVKKVLVPEKMITLQVGRFN
jgi:zinc protease